MSVAAREEVLSAVRRTVRGLVEGSPAAATLPPERRRELARSLVDVSMMAADLVAEDRRITDGQAARTARRQPPLARAQAAPAPDVGAQAGGAMSTLVKSAKDSIDFPAYVSSLISSVFQAILTSTTAQLTSMGEMLDAVSATAEEFEAALPDSEVVKWTLARLPFLRLKDGELSAPEDMDASEQAGVLKTALGCSADEVSGIDLGDIDGTVLPLARRKMARDKQGILATMVQMGLQRIVVDEGRLSASMDLRVDVRAATQHETYDENDWRVNAHAGGSYGAGLWNVNADVSTSVGQVHTDKQESQVQAGGAAALRSNVELAFRTEQVPLDRLADEKQRVRIGQNARVPVDVSSKSTIGDAPAGGAFSQFSTATPFKPDAPPPLPTPPTPPSAADSKAAADKKQKEEADKKKADEDNKAKAALAAKAKETKTPEDSKKPEESKKPEDSKTREASKPPEGGKKGAEAPKGSLDALKAGS